MLGNDTKEILLLVKKYTDTPLGQTMIKAFETLKLKLKKQMATFSLNPP